MNLSRLFPIGQWSANLLQKLRNRSADSLVRFKCVIGGYYVSSPVTTAKDCVPKDGWYDRMLQAARVGAQKKEKGAGVKFVRCPGMHDYMQAGYIIYAHTDIHIKANRMGVVVDMPQLRDREYLQHVPMDYEVVDGLAPIGDDVKKMVIKIPIPWAVYTDPGYSCHVMPALMHFPHLDKLWVYPGTVDYERFHTCNFIFSILKECEFTIPQGTPILQVLPFKRVDFHGVSGPATKLESDQLLYGFMSRVKAFYRKKFHYKKKYTIEVEK